MGIFLLIFAFADPLLAMAKHKDCHAPYELPASLVNPVGIKSYIQQNGLHDIGDFLCCLPESYRNNYVVAHSSISAQNSHYKSPRLLFYNRFDPEKFDSIQTVLSVNGGAPDLLQTANIEILHNNRIYREVELFDIEVKPKGHPELSEKNPAKCMACHGNQGENGPGGPHPNFDPFFQWVRFSDGILGGCPTEAKHQALLKKGSAEAIKSNPRFRCLSPPDDSINKLAQLDNALSMLNSRRVTKLARATKDYDKYKYVIWGNKLCSNGFSSDNPFDLRDWLPESELAKLKDESFLPKELRSGSDLFSSFRRIVSEMNRENRESEAKMKEAILQIEQNKPADFVTFRHRFAVDPASCTAPLEGAKAIFDSFTNSGINLLDRYKLASHLKGSQDGALRFLFEARGIDTGSWDMSATHGEYRRGLDLNLADLLRYESDPALKEIRKKLFSYGFATEEDAPLSKLPAIDLSKSKGFIEKTCEFFKSRSLAQFVTKKNTGKKATVEAAPTEDNKRKSSTIDAR